MSRRVLARLALGAALASPVAWAPAAAHDFSITDVLVVFKSDGTYQVDMTLDVDALALGVPPDSDSAENAARLSAMSTAQLETLLEGTRETLLRRVRLRFDGASDIPQVDFPELGTPLASRRGVPGFIGTTVRLTGVVPQGARAFTFGASRAFAAVQLTVLDQASARGIRHVLGVAEDSPTFVLGEPPAASSSTATLARYFGLGFEHILPKGTDHVLFVLGLFLLSPRLGPLLWQVTAFTVAHSVTLGLAMAEVVTLPSSVVEPLIALSIAYVAIENIATSELKPWRPALVFGFGLLHGLGFAGVLRELGLPEGEFAAALVGFNAGVEAGQLAIVSLALLAVGWFRRESWYRAVIVVPASALISAAGLYWAIERVL